MERHAGRAPLVELLDGIAAGGDADRARERARLVRHDELGPAGWCCTDLVVDRKPDALSFLESHPDDALDTIGEQGPHHLIESGRIGVGGVVIADVDHDDRAVVGVLPAEQAAVDRPGDRGPALLVHRLRQQARPLQQRFVRVGVRVHAHAQRRELGLGERRPRGDD